MWELPTEIERNTKMFEMQKSYSYKQEKLSSSSIKRSQTTSTIEAKRGFKPSDRFDPNKKSFLVDLSKKIWNKRVWLIDSVDDVHSDTFD